MAFSFKKLCGYCYRKQWRLAKREFRFFKQRCIRGFDNSDLWSFDVTIAQFMVPRLKVFKKIKCGYPSCFSSEEEWNEVLDKMIKAFELIADEKYFLPDEQSVKIVDEGLKLFCEHFSGLWY